MICYSPHRATSYFNWACFAADIFNVISCLSWAGWNSQNSFLGHHFWHFTNLEDIYRQIWYDQILCITVAMGFIIALFLVIYLPFLQSFWGEGPMVLLLGSIYFVLVIILSSIAVLMMVSQIFKLFSLCFVFGYFEGNLLKSKNFYTQWLHWILLSPTSFDLNRRLGVSFWTLGIMGCLRCDAKNNWELSLAVSNIPYDKLTCRVLRDLGMKSNLRIMLHKAKERCNLMFPGNDLFAGRMKWVLLLVLLPCYIVSVLYNLVYPFLALSAVGDDADSIQIIFSSIYYILFGLVIISFPAMYRYRRLTCDIPFLAIDVKGVAAFAFQNIENEYAIQLNKIYTEQLVTHFFQRLAPIMIEMIGPQRNPTMEREIYFMRDPLRYSQDRLTIFELEDVLYMTKKPYDESID